MLDVFVHGGRAGGCLASEMKATAVIVDALRASATVASLLEHGATEVLVVEQIEEALAEKERLPEAITLGERGGLRVEGFDLGNSPLTEALPGSPATVIFTSSNCSRCCVAAAPQAPEILLGSTINASAVTELLRAKTGPIMFVPAGLAQDETRLIIEDYLACGLLIDRLGAQAHTANDGAVMALTLFRAVGEDRLEEYFCNGDNGRRLISMGFERDVRLASHIDVYSSVPRRVSLRQLPTGRLEVVLKAAQ